MRSAFKRRGVTFTTGFQAVAVRCRLKSLNKFQNRADSSAGCRSMGSHAQDVSDIFGLRSRVLYGSLQPCQYAPPRFAVSVLVLTRLQQVDVRNARDSNVVSVVFAFLKMRVSTIKTAIGDFERCSRSGVPVLPPSFDELVQQIGAEWDREKGKHLLRLRDACFRSDHGLSCIWISKLR